jgi:dihydrofolate reductase
VGKLIYSLNVSLDGFVETPDHGLEWATVDDELHTWFNDQARALEASLYGRRMYELMADYWPTGEARHRSPAQTPTGSNCSGTSMRISSAATSVVSSSLASPLTFAASPVRSWSSLSPTRPSMT